MYKVLFNKYYLYRRNKHTLLLLYYCIFVNSLIARVPLTGAEKNPLPPRQLRARAISSHAIKLKWYDPERFKGQGTRFYSIRYSAVGDENSSKFIQTQERRARVSKLHPNTTYVLVVRSVVGKRGSPWSKSVTATTTIAGKLMFESWRWMWNWRGCVTGGNFYYFYYIYFLLLPLHLCRALPRSQRLLDMEVKQ